ncbi:MAG: hypothetical protein ACLR76_09410 [Alistipes sp.]
MDSPAYRNRYPGRIDEGLIAGIRSIDLINRLVCDIEKNAYSIPVLIRKYLQLNSSVLGFNTDHEFATRSTR